MFWQTIIKYFSNVDVEVQSVGGSDILDSYIERIVKEDLNVVVARDADFLNVCGKSISHSRVLYTFGYSIENSLYNSDALRSISRLWCKNNKTTDAMCREWLENIYISTKDLVYFDIANFAHNYSLSVVGDNCTRFLPKPDAHILCNQKIESFIQTLQEKISKRHFNSSLKAVASIGGDWSIHLRGHFLASAVLKFISARLKESGRNAKLSYDAMYTNAIQFLEHAFNNSHPHYEHYRHQIHLAFGKK